MSNPEPSPASFAVLPAGGREIECNVPEYLVAEESK